MVKNVSWIENKGFRQLARMELPGAGQVVVDGNYAYLANMKPPLGTTILDISDPKDPKIVSQIEIPLNVHSHKVNVSGDIMLVNHEKYRSYEGSEVSRGGLKIFEEMRSSGFVPVRATQELEAEWSEARGTEQVEAAEARSHWNRIL